MAADPFTSALGTERRGSGQHRNEPRYLDAPATTAASFTSLADFRRRVRKGARVTFDSFDELGRVQLRHTGYVIYDHRGRFSVDEDGSIITARYPQRRTDCELDGPTLTLRRGARNVWRVTLLQESIEPAPKTTAARSPRPDPASWDSIYQELRELTGGFDLNTHWPYNPDGDALFCWTTERASDERYLSFALVAVSKPQPGKRVRDMRFAKDSVSRHRLRKDASARAERLTKRYQTGERRPWR